MEAKQPGYFYDRLKRRLEEVGLSLNRLSELSEISRNRFPEWRRKDRIPSDNEIERLASVKELNLLKEQLLAWRLIEIYGSDAMKSALQILMETDPEEIERCVQARKAVLGY